MPHPYSLLCVMTILICMSGINSMGPTCDSDIYCYGNILEMVQSSNLFVDSKTFVDMKMKMSAKEIKKRYELFMKEHNNKPSKEDVKEFVNQYFDKPGSEFEDFNPQDWKEKPRILNNINDPQLQEWATQLHNLWKQLGRKVKKDVKSNADRYSLIYVPNPVIVPGGRFREFYYWDSYWVILGLLHSEMFTTAKGMLENFTHIVKKYGLVPNGGRIYYLKRSQPPLLIPMVNLYYNVTKDLAFVKSNIDELEREFMFWVKNRIVSVEINNVTFKLAVYRSESDGPRPESFREDIHTASTFKTKQEKNKFYSELKSACESGWDFSSRWFISNYGKGNLTDLKIMSIIPVDLNAILFWNAHILNKLLILLNNPKKADTYKKYADAWRTSVTAVLWSEEDGSWYDYDLISKKPRKEFYPSNIAPLWTECYNTSNREVVSEKVVNYLSKIGIHKFRGGVPTSITQSGEQWDFPNAWPPLQHMVITGLQNSGTSKAKAMAFELANNWIQANYKGYTKTSAMFEKYDAIDIGGYGGGGEYEVQLGFGWTNGVCLDLLVKYGSRLVTDDSDVNFLSIGCKLVIAVILIVW